MLEWLFGRKKTPNRPAAPQKKAEPLPLPEQVPDSPIPFGYKIGWLCIKSDSPQAVMEALDLRECVPCSWADGLERAGMNGQVFLSPCLDGFVLAVGWMEEKPANLIVLAERFPDVQFFASHRVVNYCAWARFRDGALLRCYVCEEDRVAWDEGGLTPEEISLSSKRFHRAMDDDDWENFPDEEDVLALAAAWGVDTSFSKKQYPAELGWLGRRAE